MCVHGLVSTRRALLRSGTVVAASGVAGCLSEVGFGGTNETVGVSLHNDDDEPHDISVAVTFDGETLLEHSASLGPGRSADTGFANPDTAGSARVEAALGSGESTTAEVRVGPGTGIRYVTAAVTADGDLSVYATRT